MMDDINSFFEEIGGPQYLRKVDFHSPGLFIMKTKTTLPHELMESMRLSICHIIEKHSPNSSVLLLDNTFDSVDHIPEELMNKLGWVRKEESPET